MAMSSSSSDPRKELASTYMVADRSSEEELARLQLQDGLLTASMGGVLAEQSDPERFGRILDVGCGPGGWLLETARQYPGISLLVGIDISQKMLEVARQRASELQLTERVEFRVMDALRMLEFPDASFNLVNQRAGISWLRTWEWPKLLQEYQRVLRAGGVVRITEVNGALQTSSPALMSLWNLSAEAFYRAGISFSLSGDGLGKTLAFMLEQYGWRDVYTQTFTLEYRPETPLGKLFIEDMVRLYHVMRPFLERWLRLPDNYQELCQQMRQEVSQPDFSATAILCTVWGTR